MLYTSKLKQNKKNINPMFLGDITQIQQHLNNDWTLILKNIKTREDSLYQLLQYNKKIITKQRDQDQDQLFVKDQIKIHQTQLNKLIKTNILDMQPQQKQILQKYQGTTITFQQIIKLMGRVGARIIQTYQYSIDKCKVLDDQLMQKYLKIKNHLIKLFNQKDKINLEEITVLVIGYSKNKLMMEIQKLKKIIKILENGEFQKLQETYHPQPQIKKNLFINTTNLTDKKYSNDKVKVSSIGKSQKSPIKQQILKQQKLKKQKIKLAQRLVNHVYSTMDLNRLAFMQDMSGTTKQKQNRLYNQIFSRNKFNYQQILAFQAKKQEFKEKVRCFKEMMERQSNKIGQVLINTKSKHLERNRDKNINFILNMSMGHELSIQHQEQHDEPQQKILSNRYRISSPKPKNKDYNQSYVNNMNTTQSNFTHFKFDKSNNQIFPRSNRNKLPLITNSNHFNPNQISRASSFDQRIDINKHKIVREQLTEIKEKKQIILNCQQIKGQRIKQGNLNGNTHNNRVSKEQRYIVQRTKMQLKNIQVGVDGVVMKKQSSELLVKQKKKIQPNPMEYTFYVKSNNKFYEPRHNIIL